MSSPSSPTSTQVVARGLRARRIGSHQLNHESSRSHCIFTIYAQATPLDPARYDYNTARFGKLSFVDLAGSERLKLSKSTGVMVKETTSINTSLFALGKVISALADVDNSVQA